MAVNVNQIQHAITCVSRVIAKGENATLTSADIQALKVAKMVLNNTLKVDKKD
jgi:hypothetical protein